jgi:hypothetical protein
MLLSCQQCMRCEMFGDMDAGQCYGPGICCGQGKCIFSSGSVCKMEATRLSSPCRPEGARCSLPPNRQGVCVPYSRLCCATGNNYST